MTVGVEIYSSFSFKGFERRWDWTTSRFRKHVPETKMFTFIRTLKNPHTAPPTADYILKTEYLSCAPARIRLLYLNKETRSARATLPSQTCSARTWGCRWRDASWPLRWTAAAPPWRSSVPAAAADTAPPGRRRRVIGCRFAGGAAVKQKQNVTTTTIHGC